MRNALNCLALFVVLLHPATVLAQASLTGTVRDASGGVLPGVTVEAASPALIEKVRSAVTDDTGQYRIIDLRPGTYSLTFTLPGFSTVIRDKIELTGSQTLTIPVELRVGGLEETITVTGESPVVDVQNATDRDCAQQRDHPDDSGDARRRRAAQRHAWHLRRRRRVVHLAGNDLVQRAFEHHQRDHGGRRGAVCD